MVLRGTMFLLGPSGVGKTSLADALSRRDNSLKAFHGGTRLRQAAAADPGGPIAMCINDNRPVPPDLFVNLFEASLDEFSEKTLVFDGFPRSIEQASTIPKILEIAGVGPSPNVVRVVELAPSPKFSIDTIDRSECPACGRVAPSQFYCTDCDEPSVPRAVQDGGVEERTRLAELREALRSEYAYNLVEVGDTPESTADAVLRLLGLADVVPQVGTRQDPRDLVDVHLNAVIDAFRLHKVKRFFHQRFFEEETREAEYAARIEPSPRLETVSEHSWHLADAILTVAPAFDCIDIARAVQLAVVHDKLEMYIGDVDPIGRDGTGRKAHAFNREAKERKRRREEEALTRYLDTIPVSSRSIQEDLHREALDCSSPEARFVKSLDKLAAIAFILIKKRGAYTNDHLRLIFTLTERNSLLYPDLSQHHWRLFDRIAVDAARARSVGRDDIYVLVDRRQPQLFETA